MKNKYRGFLHFVICGSKDAAWPWAIIIKVRKPRKLSKSTSKCENCAARFSS